MGLAILDRASNGMCMVRALVKRYMDESTGYCFPRNIHRPITRMNRVANGWSTVMVTSIRDHLSVRVSDMKACEVAFNAGLVSRTHVSLSCFSQSWRPDLLSRPLLACHHQSGSLHCLRLHLYSRASGRLERRTLIDKLMYITDRI